MNSFSQAVDGQLTYTENGMPTYKSSMSNVVDLFYKIGTLRSADPIPHFVKSYIEDPELTLRVVQWARDVRGGAGEREVFRKVIRYLQNVDENACLSLLKKIPEIGRMDDLFAVTEPKLREKAFSIYKQELLKGNGLAFKWAPREKSTKKELAKEFRKFLKMSAKNYRKYLVAGTNVVESQMCSNDWDNINFNHVPSLASIRYKKAFYRNAEEVYSAYVNDLISGKDGVKINAGAVYPYNIVNSYRSNRSDVSRKHTIAQWEALPNYVMNASILPMVDVSGSMTTTIGANSNVTCMDVSISLGLYCADKNKGKFKDLFLTFSGKPEICRLTGNITDKIDQLQSANWDMNTNVMAAYDLILKTAIDGNVPQEEMPGVLLILSDMQFDSCAKFDSDMKTTLHKKFNKAGYNLPRLVFWNISNGRHSADNVPVRFNENGVALVSGCSPSILEAVLSSDFEEFSPQNIMLKAIMNPRYDI